MVAGGRGWSRSVQEKWHWHSEDLIGRGRRRAVRQPTSSATNRHHFLLLGNAVQFFVRIGSNNSLQEFYKSLDKARFPMLRSQPKRMMCQFG